MLDIIYADPYLREQGMLEYAEGDFTIGIQNNFFLKVPQDLGLDQDWYLMKDGSEFGGVIDGIEIDTSEDYIIASGRTWQGILETSVLIPNQGQAYVTVSGDCHSIIQSLLERQGLTNVFYASSEPSGFSVSNYRMLSATGERYSDLYTGFRRLVTSVGAKLQFAYDGNLRKVCISVVPVVDYVEDGLDGDRVAFVITTTRPVNHLIALGQGDLENRVVVHVYADTRGNVSTTQTILGIGHKSEVYDNPNCDNANDLRAYALETLKTYQTDLESCKLAGEQESIYDIDDIVGAYSSLHDKRIVTTIAQKIAHADGDEFTFETKTALEVQQ